MQANVIEKIRQEINIVEIIAEYLNLTKKGNNFIAICPFHEDSHPSLTISPAKQIFKCFACGVGGDVITFTSRYEKITFQQALKKLAQKLNINLEIHESKPLYSVKESKMIEVLKDANNFFMNTIMTPQGQLGYEYATKRHLNKKLLEKFRIGYSGDNDDLLKFLQSKNHDEVDMINSSLITKYQRPFFKNRLTFAIENMHGDIVGFSGRTIEDDRTKYLNSSESLLFNKSQLLYNFANAREAIKSCGEIVIVEGFMDVIALHKAQINNVIALMGTNLSTKQIELLKNYQVILMLDFDKAGLKATLNFLKILLQNNINCQIVDNDLQQDPDEIFNQGGSILLQKIFQKRLSALEFAYQKLIPEQTNVTVKMIEDFINKFQEYLILSNELEQEFYSNKIAKYFELSKSTIEKLLKINRVSVNKQIGSLKKEQNRQQKNEPMIYAKQYEIIVLRSMMKNPQFITQFMENNLQFNDKNWTQISQYLIDYHQKRHIIVTPEIKEQCQKILQESGEIAQSSVEFQEYIDRIKWTNAQRTHQKIEEAIKNITDPNVAIQLLEEQIKLKRGKN